MVLWVVQLLQLLRQGLRGGGLGLLHGWLLHGWWGLQSLLLLLLLLQLQLCHPLQLLLLLLLLHLGRKQAALVTSLAPGPHAGLAPEKSAWAALTEVEGAPPRMTLGTPRVHLRLGCQMPAHP